MSTQRIALVIGANQGMGRQSARELAAGGVTVFAGSRHLARGEKAAADIGHGATALRLDVTDAASITVAAERIRAETGRLDLLVNNAARIVNVTSAIGSLTTVADPGFPFRAAFEPVYAASKSALKAVTLAIRHLHHLGRRNGPW